MTTMMLDGKAEAEAEAEAEYRTGLMDRNRIRVTTYEPTLETKMGLKRDGARV
jgi:hypothetical protein